MKTASSCASLSTDFNRPGGYGITSGLRAIQRAGWHLCHLLLIIACLAGFSYVSVSHASSGSWSKADGSLSYRATVLLLGKATPVELSFSCEIAANRCTESGSRLDWAIFETGPLKPFDFEVLDVTRSNAKMENRLMQITVARKGPPDLVRVVRAQGVEASEGIFVFNLNPNSVIVEQNPTEQPSSVPEILQALAKDDAISLKISVTDSKNSKLKLDIDVPLVGRHSEFRALLNGLR